MRRIQASPFAVGDKVRLRPDVLARHARSVPAHAGFTHEQFEWRKTLDDLEGQTGEIQRTFENSRHVNVQFPGILIGIDHTELEGVPTGGDKMPFSERFDVEYYRGRSKKPERFSHGTINDVVNDYRLTPPEEDQVAALNYGDSCQIDFEEGDSIIVHRIAGLAEARRNPDGPRDVSNEWEKASENDREDMLRKAGIKLDVFDRGAIDETLALPWRELPGSIRVALSKAPKPHDPERFGIFVYEEGGKNALVYSEYSAKRSRALKDGMRLSRDAEREYDFPTFTEVWERDAEGYYGNTGIPVWASRRSGYRKKFPGRFRGNPRVEKREYTVYKFNELSEEGKQKALDDNRQLNVDYEEWWDFLREGFVEDLAKIGIDASKAKFYWSLDRSMTFYMDGARISDSRKLIKKAKVTLAELGVKSVEEFEGDFSGVRIETRHHGGGDASNYVEPDTSDGKLTEFLRDTLHGFWKRLDDAYLELTDDDAVAETLVANDYDFTADGKMFNE